MTTLTENTAELQRELGLPSAICLIISDMLGSGIFVSAASVLENTGSVSMCLVLWVLCGLISLLVSLSYAELATVVNKSGGDFSYYQTAFGSVHKFWGPLPSFVNSWVIIMCAYPAGVAITMMTFAQHVVEPLGMWLFLDPSTEYALKKAVTIMSIGIITLINYSSVKNFIKIQFVFTTCKVVACVLVIGGGMYQLYKGNTDNLMTGFEGTTLTIKSLPVAMYSCLWAFSGGEAAAIVVEEIKNPQRNVLLSILLALPFITLIYVLMNVSYMTVLSKSEMISTSTVAIKFGSHVLGGLTFVIPLTVAVSTFSNALSSQFEATRMCMVTSREGHMLNAFSYVSVKKLTPTPAVLLQGLLTFICCLICEDIIKLIEFTSFLFWVFTGLSVVALLVMRRTKKDVKRPFKLPIVVPVIILVVCAILFLTPIISEPKPQYLVALVLVFSALPLYVPFVYLKKRWSIVGTCILL
ncbi:Hypothetical protein CINCED_3A024114 [Cinara cedri]|uniref:Amino acid/polyamine transporter I n=1 Tax=Cinara cedri TaxID=506608 RepID=A0A5E4N4F1_9HEMI|nr:Hypothetical protein CINCED_3A024114 [Cinara cedri]